MTKLVQLEDGTSAPPGQHFLRWLVSYTNLLQDRNVTIPSDVSVELDVPKRDLAADSLDYRNCDAGNLPGSCVLAADGFVRHVSNNLHDDTNVPPGQTLSAQFSCPNVPDTIPSSDVSVWTQAAGGKAVRIPAG